MVSKLASILLVIIPCLAIMSATPSCAGKLIPGSPISSPGEWYIGDTPSNSGDKPVLLFVHGYNGSASSWYGENNMYQTAYNNGYQTVFIDMYNDKNMWDNGYLLAEKIAEIYEYFGRNLVIVAHSKGGIDTQSALIHHGAYPYVSNVITLGSPHHGSQLADLAYSSWAGWLAPILGLRSDTIYSLQTSYMRYFRSITDSHENVNRNGYFTFAGNSWGSFGGTLYWGGLYLRQFGKNDGAVVVSHSNLPNGTTVRVDSWNHYNIHHGSSTFRWFRPYLNLETTTQEPLQIMSTEEVLYKELEHTEEMMDMLVRGGQYKGLVEQNFYVEKGVKNLMLDWLTAYPVEHIELVGPNNKKQKVQVNSFQNDDIFNGAWHHEIKLKNPKAGEWKILSSSNKGNFYLFTVLFESKLGEKIKFKKDKNLKKWDVIIDDLQLVKDKMRVKYTVEFYPSNKGRDGSKEKRVLSGEQNVTSSIQMLNMDEEGVYNITVDISGVTVEGEEFERTFISSVYVDSNGKMY